MSLFTPAIFKAVRDRLAADTTLTGLLAGASANAITWEMPQQASDPPSGFYPRVVLEYVADERDEAFKTRRVVYTFEVHIYHRERAASGEDAVLTMAKIAERIVGDWPDQTSRTPTYGLDRWAPDFTAQTGDYATSYAAETMLHTGSVNATDRGSGLIEWVLTFQVGLDKAST